MNMLPVENSHITAIGYDEATNTIRVLFKSGGLYEATGPTPEECDAFRSSDSKGKHFAAHLKSKYVFVRVEEE